MIESLALLLFLLISYESPQFSDFRVNFVVEIEPVFLSASYLQQVVV